MKGGLAGRLEIGILWRRSNNSLQVSRGSASLDLKDRIHVVCRRAAT